MYRPLSSMCAICAEFSRRHHLTGAEMRWKYGINVWSRASSWPPLRSRVGYLMLCSESMTDQVLRVPMTWNSEGPFLSRDVR